MRQAEQSPGRASFPVEYGATRRVAALLNADARAVEVHDQVWLRLLRGEPSGDGPPSRFDVFRTLFDELEGSGLLPAPSGRLPGEVFEADGPWQGWWMQPVPVQAWPEPAATGALLPAALRRLPLLERITLLLDAPGGLTPAQAAEVTGLPVEQHRTVLGEARLHLVAVLDELADGAGRAG